MRDTLQPPASRYDDYDYDSAKDAGLIHRPLVGGSWVTQYQSDIEFWQHLVSKESRPYRLKRLQQAMLNLELARRGYRVERKLTWGEVEYRLHKIDNGSLK